MRGACACARGELTAASLSTLISRQEACPRHARSRALSRRNLVSVMSRPMARRCGARGVAGGPSHVAVHGLPIAATAELRRRRVAHGLQNRVEPGLELAGQPSRKSSAGTRPSFVLK